MSTGVHVEGLRETVRNLERLGVSAEDLKEAFGRISRDVVAEASAIVPVLDGDLQATIRPARTKNKAVVRAGTSSTVPYAAVINYGWAGHGIAATEFLTGPANTNVDERVRAIEDNLAELIRRYDL